MTIQKAPIMLYHGTSAANWERIQKEGLKPNGGKGADDWGRKQYGFAPKNRHSVYFTPDPDIAGSFAHFAAEMTDSAPVVLSVVIPAENRDTVIEDEEAFPFGYRYPGAIDPAWIAANHPADPETAGIVSGGG